jgi:hypothetical protein
MQTDGEHHFPQQNMGASSKSKRAEKWRQEYRGIDIRNNTLIAGGHLPTMPAGVLLL